jgi:hypothetical protein
VNVRTYKPSCGTWLQSDPRGGLQSRPTSLNKYDYTENNPVTYTDYLGYMRPTDDGGPGSGTVSITDPCQLMPDACSTPNPAPVIKPSPPRQQLPNIPGGGDNGPTPPTGQQDPTSGTLQGNYGLVCEGNERCSAIANSGHDWTFWSHVVADGGAGGLCVAGDAAIGLAGNVQVCTITTGDGSTAVVASPGGGLGGIGISATAQGVWTNATTPQDLTGWFTYAGVTVAVGPLGFSATCSWGQNGEGRTIYVCGGGFAVGGIAAAQSGRSCTYVISATEPSK